MVIKEGFVKILSRGTTGCSNIAVGSELQEIGMHCLVCCFSSIDTLEVIRRIATLFREQSDLIVRFNTFLPPGYMIEEVQGDKIIVVHQPVQQVMSLSTALSPPNKTGQGSGVSTTGGGGGVGKWKPCYLLAVWN